MKRKNHFFLPPATSATSHALEWFILILDQHKGLGLPQVLKKVLKKELKKITALKKVLKKGDALKKVLIKLTKQK